MNDSGNVVHYQVSPNKGDGTLNLYLRDQDTTIVFERGYKGQLDASNNWFVFKVKPTYLELREAERKELKKEKKPKDHLVIYRIDSSCFDTIYRVKNFAMPKDYPGVMACKIGRRS